MGKVISLPGGGCGAKAGTGFNGNATYTFANQDDVCDGNTDINTRIYIDPTFYRYKVNGIAGQGSCN